MKARVMEFSFWSNIPNVILGIGSLPAEAALSSASTMSCWIWDIRDGAFFPPPAESDAAQRIGLKQILRQLRRMGAFKLGGDIRNMRTEAKERGGDGDGRKISLRTMFAVVLIAAIWIWPYPETEGSPNRLHSVSANLFWVFFISFAWGGSFRFLDQIKF